MFLLNSRLGLFSATCSQAPLFPKLRGHFAEFLNKGYLAHLRILSSPTCVGLRYGRPFSFLAAFLASVNSWISLLNFITHLTHSLITGRTVLPNPTRYLTRDFHPSGSTILLCPCIGLNRITVVLEYLPAVHRLHLSVSP